MNVQCQYCNRIFDDVVFRYSPCPAHPPVQGGGDYCRRHDLFNCPYCPPMYYLVRQRKNLKGYELLEFANKESADSNVRIKFDKLQEVSDFIEVNLPNREISWIILQ